MPTLPTPTTKPPWLGLPIGVNDRNGNPIHIGDVLHFDPAEWGSDDCYFCVEFNAGKVHYPGGAASALTAWCVIVRKWAGEAKPPVDIEAVFAGTAPVPNGWKSDLATGDYTDYIARGEVTIWRDGSVRLGGNKPITAEHEYPTLAEAWKVAQAVAARLDVGEELTELPAPKPTMPECDPPAYPRINICNEPTEPIFRNNSEVVGGSAMTDRITVLEKRVDNLLGEIAALKGGRW